MANETAANSGFSQSRYAYPGMAAINATRQVQQREAWIPARDQAYLGVLVDDLIRVRVHHVDRSPRAEVETLPVAEGTKPAAIHRVHAQRPQAESRQPVKVGKPASVGLRRESFPGLGVLFDKGAAHLRTDFEGLRADGRTQPRQQLPRR